MTTGTFSLPLMQGLLLSGVLFGLGLVGLLVRRNIIFMLMAVEIMLNAAGLAFVVAGARWGRPTGKSCLFSSSRSRRRRCRSDWRSCCGFIVNSTRLTLMRPAECGARMLELLWLVPALPLFGFVTLAVAGGWCSRRLLAVIGVGSVAGSMVVAGLVSLSFWRAVSPDHAYSQTLWTWMSVSSFTTAIGFYLDALSLVMMLVITVVSVLIHVYSAEFMIDDEGYRRFFAYMNLFVAAMLTLVLADNLVLLYLGWEGVGLCSYLLIGFWYREPANGRGGPEGLHRDTLGGCGAGDRSVSSVRSPGYAEHPRPHATCRFPMACRIGAGDCRRSIAARGGPREVRAASLADLASRCHGRPQSRERAHPCGHHGHGGGLSDRPHAWTLQFGALCSDGGRGHRRGYAIADRLQRSGAARPQTRVGLLHHQPDRVHVFSPWGRSLDGGDVSFHDPCLL